MRLFAIAAAFLIAACTTEPRPVLSASDCVEIAIYSTGFHTGIAAPAEAFAPDHPMRRLFPDAAWIVAGWGDSDFFREPEGGDFMQGARAIFPGGETVVQVIGLPIPPGDYFASTVVHAGVDRAGAARLAAYLESEVKTGPQGEVEIISEGHHPGRSYFLRGADEAFHLFNNCNHWTSRALRAAGLPVGAAMTADGVVNRLERVAAPCPDPAAASGDDARS